MTAKKYEKSVVYDKCSLRSNLDRSDLNETRVISLESPNIARWGDKVGTWTLVYDQGNQSFFFKKQRNAKNS